MYSPQVRDLHTSPAYQEDDLGITLPDDRHAISVCLPTWDSVIGYEEKRDKVMSRLRAGYPRFFLHPAVDRLFIDCKKSFASEGENVVVFPNRAAAQRALRFVEKRTSEAMRIVGFDGLQVLVGPEVACEKAMEYWRYSGEVISSRQALDVLDGDGLWKYDTSSLLRRLEGFGGYEEGDVFLYESGMSAVFAVHRILCKLTPSKKTLQLDFPYVDVLKVQNHFGLGAVFLNEAYGELLDEALTRIRAGEFSAVFCEVPSNPLLRTVDIIKVSKACKEGNVPLVIDDTVASNFNVDVKPYADIVTSSLSKWVSGKGDVMAGAVQLVKGSTFHDELRYFFDDEAENGGRLYAADAAVLDNNSQGYWDRMQPINESSEAIVEFLQSHDAIDKIWYPSLLTKENYDALKRDKGSYGGLISFTLKNDKKTSKFYDTLEISKGPSLGTEFSLVSPYTMLAHYDQLEWAEGCGVPAHLIRLSVGLEDVGVLISRISASLDIL